MTDFRIRGRVLTRIRLGGSDGVTAEYLVRVFRYGGYNLEAMNLDENLAYLIDRGYVRREQKRDAFSGVERWLYSLTSTGLDLIQGTIPPDPGVALDGSI